MYLHLPEFAWHLPNFSWADGLGTHWIFFSFSSLLLIRLCFLFCWYMLRFWCFCETLRLSLRLLQLTCSNTTAVQIFVKSRSMFILTWLAAEEVKSRHVFADKHLENFSRFLFHGLSPKPLSLCGGNPSGHHESIWWVWIVVGESV